MHPAKGRAEYSDAATFSQRLLSSMADYDGTALLDKATTGYWSEHSERAGVDTWLAAVGVGADERNFIGRWAVKGSADVYARTAIRIMENLQGKAAAYAQIVHAGGADYFGDEHALYNMAEWLRKRGAKEEQIESQVYRLAVANYALPVGDAGSNPNDSDGEPSHASPPRSAPSPSPTSSAPEVLSWRTLPEPDSSGESGWRQSAADACSDGDTSIV